jgi:hypothetical protein
MTYAQGKTPRPAATLSVVMQCEPQRHGIQPLRRRLNLVWAVPRPPRIRLRKTSGESRYRDAAGRASARLDAHRPHSGVQQLIDLLTVLMRNALCVKGSGHNPGKTEPFSYTNRLMRSKI